MLYAACAAGVQVTEMNWKLSLNNLKMIFKLC